METPIQKPTILCLHGGGTSAAIYKIQTLRLRRALSPYFSFAFLNAPFVAAPGPGVLPFFEGAGPFYTWVRPSDGGKIPRESRSLVDKAMKKHYAETGQPFAAIMGFSQGAKVGAAIMMEQQKRRQQGGNVLEAAKFGIFLMGMCPAVDGAERLHLPTIHVVGKQDVYRQESKKLWAECCQRGKSELIELPVGHQVPSLEEHTRKMVAETLKVYCRALML